MQYSNFKRTEKKENYRYAEVDVTTNKLFTSIVQRLEIYQHYGDWRRLVDGQELPDQAALAELEMSYDAREALKK